MASQQAAQDDVDAANRLYCPAGGVVNGTKNGVQNSAVRRCSMRIVQRNSNFHIQWDGESNHMTLPGQAD
jgi:hypothetical protein